MSWRTRYLWGIRSAVVCACIVAGAACLQVRALVFFGWVLFGAGSGGAGVMFAFWLGFWRGYKGK